MSENEGKLNKLAVLRNIKAAWSNGFNPGDWINNEEKFHCYFDGTGGVEYFREKSGKVLAPITREYLMRSITLCAVKNDRHWGSHSLKQNDYMQILKEWEACQESINIDSIEPICEKSNDCYTFRRLPFDFSPGPFPTFEEFLYRISNGDAFCIWIGSLFFREADRQQYVWMFGEGGDGKGSVVRVLSRIFGDAFSSEVVPARDDKFWTSGLVGKRLVAFPDCNNYGFVTTGLFKSLTGGDPVRIERKNMNSKTINLNCKFIFLSNETPMISTKRADMRRIIFCEVDKITQDFGVEYEQMLWKETPHFLSFCIDAYKKNMIKHNRRIIAVEKDVTEMLANDNEDVYNSIFNRFYVLDPKSEVKSDVIHNNLAHHGHKLPFIRNFQHWLSRQPNISRARESTSRARIYRGIACKPNMDMLVY